MSTRGVKFFEGGSNGTSQPFSIAGGKYTFTLTAGGTATARLEILDFFGNWLTRADAVAEGTHFYELSVCAVRVVIAGANANSVDCGLMPH